MHLMNWWSESVTTSINARFICSILVCVLTWCKGGQTSAMMLKKQLLLPINLGRALRPFPKNFTSIIPQWTRSFFCKGSNYFLLCPDMWNLRNERYAFLDMLSFSHDRMAEVSTPHFSKTELSKSITLKYKGDSKFTKITLSLKKISVN